MNKQWDDSFWGLCLRLIWLLVFGLAVIGILHRFGGLDDASSRKLQDNTVLPSERAKDINYGPIQ